MSIVEDDIIAPAESDKQLVETMTEFQSVQHELDCIKDKMASELFLKYEDKYAYYQTKAIKEVRGMIEESLCRVYFSKGEFVNLHEQNTIIRKYQNIRIEDITNPTIQALVLKARSYRPTINGQISK
jgi:hypothetical protein